MTSLPSYAIGHVPVNAGAERIDVDVTAADMLAVLDRELEARGIDLQFAGLPGHVKDQIIRYGLSPRFDADHFHPTVGNAVNIYRGRHTVDWKDWDER